MKFIEKSSLSHPLKKSLEYSWKEGAVTQFMIGIFDYFLIPYALFLGASPQEIGFLVAIPNISVSFAQLVAPRFILIIGSRLRALLGGTAVQTALLVLIGSLVFWPFPNKTWPLIAMIGFFRMVGSIVGPAWGSLISDYLPENMRGKYFGWRSRIMGVAGILGLLFWGGVLFMSKYVSGNIAFALLFLGAALFRLMAFYLISRMQDLPMHSDPQHHFTFWMFIRRFRESNFVKYIGYVSSVTFATQLALPYLNVHMLENLGFSYLEYTLIHVTGMFSALVGYPVWGKHADHIGNAHVLKLISFILPVFPLMWIFAKTPLAFIGIELISGFMWGGFNLCSINFIYDACSAPKRVRCLSYFNLINGGAIFAGASLGGYLMENLPALYGYPVIGLFILSAFFRLMAHFCLSKTFEEVRVVRHLPSSMNLFASIIGVRPLFGRQDITEENEY